MSKKIFLTYIIIILSIPFLFACDKECSHDSMTRTLFDPTCGSEGYTLNECDDCDFEYKSDFVAAKGHTLSEALFAPTCSTEGYTYYSCACGYAYKSDFLPPVGHTLSSEKVQPSCTEQGYTLLSCACGYSYKSDIVSPKGHITTQKVTAPKCTVQGYTTHSCISCDFSYISDYTSPKGHSTQSAVTSPKCTEQGYTTHSCVDCDYSYISDFTPPTGHDLQPSRTYATSFSDGHTLYSCDCGYQYVADTILSEYLFHGAYVDGSGERARGIDVSKWNGEIDWQNIKNSGIDFVIIKVGSVVGKDTQFEANYAGAKAAGLDVGCYYYSYATSVEEVLAEAEQMLEWIKGKQFEYPVYFDIEDPSQEVLARELLTDMCIAFIEKMQSNGYFCGLYLNPNWLNNFLEADRLTPFIDVWLARWTLSGEPNWSDSFGAHTGLWQYTDQGSVGDHTCAFDLNIAYKNYPRLIKDWGYNGF